MAQIVKREFLRELLEHEIKELTRIKQQLNLAEHIPAVDNLTVAVVPVEKADSEEVSKALKNALRDSDVIFPEDGFVVLLLPGTDEMGAIHILEGVAEFMGGGVKFSYAVFPEDGTSPESLIERLSTRASHDLGIKLRV